MHRAAASMFMGFSNDFPDGVTIPMWRVLAVLHERGEQRQIDLSRLTFIEESTTSRLVSTLARRGLVSRQRSKANNREVSVTLTAKGRALVERHISTVLDHEAVITRGLGTSDVQALRRYLVQIRENMERFVEGRHPSKRRARPGSPVE